MEFQEQTIKIIIDDSKCQECESKACISACKTYARGILVLKDRKTHSLRVMPSVSGQNAWLVNMSVGSGAREQSRCRRHPGLEEYRKNSEYFKPKKVEYTYGYLVDKINESSGSGITGREGSRCGPNLCGAWERTSSPVSHRRSRW